MSALRFCRRSSHPRCRRPSWRRCRSWPASAGEPTAHTYQLKRWFTWCEGNGLDPLVGIQRVHVELYIRHLRDTGLMDSSIVTMMHGVRGYFGYLVTP